MKKNKEKAGLLFLSLFFIASFAIAQPPGFGDEEPNDAEPTPISSLIGMGLVIGSYIGFKKIRKS